jgi:cation diffusion facilitator CzcD-associated flavoprotein CzcO
VWGAGRKQSKFVVAQCSDSANRRPTPGVGYLEALTQKNVRVVFDSITKVVPQGIELATGEVLELDAIVCATGFNVSWKPRFPIIGRNSIDMREQWSSRPTAYLSLAVPNFPNYIRQCSHPFMIWLAG